MATKSIATKPSNPMASQLQADVSRLSNQQDASLPADSVLNNSQDTQMSELKELTRTLMGAVQAMQSQSVRDTVFQDAIADVKSAARTMLTAPVASAYVTATTATGARDDCRDCGCDCVNSGCCEFEIVLDKVRAIQRQNEPADTGDIGPFINALEVRLFASIDGVGVLIPSLSTTMHLRMPHGGGPGLWIPLDRVIGRISVKKSSSRTVNVDFQGSEIDEGLERVIGLKDEHGAATGSITLDCCVPKIYPPMPTDLSFDFGGTGGGKPGAISLAFYARRVCC